MRGEIPKPLCGGEPAPQDAMHCAYLLEGADGQPARPRSCTAPRRPGSAYCSEHHARCRLAGGSAAEQRQLREIEALATAVGGRQGHAGRQPPSHLLRRLERLAQASLRPNRSCFVRNEADDDSANP